MVINGSTLLEYAPIKNMVDKKESNGQVSHGLSEAGYDIRIAEDILFHVEDGVRKITRNGETYTGRFTLASTLEEFCVPNNLVGIVHDKSTHIRNGLSVFNTVIECGWEGTLTLELCYHGESDLHIPAGSGIAQVIFHEVLHPAKYSGKYQNQPSGITKAIFE